MTTAEPTLEQIADGSPIDPPYPTVIDMFLARELRALREVVGINGERTSDFREEQREDGRRIQKLEQSRRNHNKRLDSNRDLMDDVLSRLAVLEDLDWSRFVDGTGHPVDALERVQRDAEQGEYDIERIIQSESMQRTEWLRRELQRERHDRAAAESARDSLMNTANRRLAERDALRDSFDELRRTLDKCGRCHQCKAHADSLAAALASATPAEGGERGPFVSGDEAQRFCGYCHDPVVGFLAVGHDCQHNGGHPVSGVTCPRAKSAMTPCIARDGRLALDDVTMECVGCSAQPKVLMADLAKRYPPAKAHLSSNNSLTLADRFRDRVAEYIATPAEGGEG